jgi:hypothetical protein
VARYDLHLKLRQVLLCRSLWTPHASRSPPCPVPSAVVTQAEDVDPETPYAMRQRLFTLAQQEVQRCEGTIQHFVDNGFLAFASSPLRRKT